MSLRASARPVRSWRALRAFARIAWISGACSLVAIAGPVRAESAALDVIRSHFQARGASAVVILGSDFVFEGQAAVRSLAFERAACVGIFAWGGTGVRDVDLGIYASSGQPLAEDRGATPYAYARLCGVAGLQVYVSAQAYAGRGELTLFRIEDAPRALGRLPLALPVAVAAGGRASGPRAVGGEDSELLFEAPLLHEERSLAAAGYVALGPPNVLDVRAGLAQGTVLLRGNACFRAVAFVPGARGLMLEIEAPFVRQEAKSIDSDSVHVALCAASDGAYNIAVRTRAMRSVALVRLFEQPLARREDAARFGDERALLAAEANVVARERGLSLSHFGEVWLEGGAAVAWPVELAAGSCHMLAALPDRGVEADVRLLDAAGVVLAHNEGRRGWPALFVCVDQPAKAKLLLRGRGGAGPVSLWVARSEMP
jgi:hypothetical protein